MIDGQQRIDAITEYLDDKFGLSESGLEMFKELKNQKYNNLKGKYKKLAYRLLDARITMIIIEPLPGKKEIVYEIFNRLLNTGGMQLNAQEIRNCMYHGDYNELIKKLAEDDENFVYSLGSSRDKLYKRMNDVELVLRFFAFKTLGRFNIDRYKPPLK